MTIKVCGITRVEDALAAAALGVHALGFVLWPGSPRATSVARMRTIIRELPPLVTPVGVFVSPAAADVARARDAGIQLAQVHGRVPRLPRGLTVLRAVRLADTGRGIVPAVPGRSPVLVDAHDPVRHGGTGRTIEWDRVRPLARLRPVVLAGGLTPANVGAAILQARPHGVDVASGVEREPGIKDHAKIAAFVAAVRAHS